MSEEMNEYSFEVHGGETVCDGKMHWPDSLNVKIPRWYILKIIASLANALQEKDLEMISFGWCGKLERYEDE